MVTALQLILNKVTAAEIANTVTPSTSTVNITKLKKPVRQCELKRSLHVCVFTIESLLCLTHLQNSSFLFVLHPFLHCLLNVDMFPQIDRHQNQRTLFLWLQH